MPFRKGLNKYLKKNTAYKYSLANKPIKNNYYMLYSYILAPIRHNYNRTSLVTVRMSR